MNLFLPDEAATLAAAERLAAFVRAGDLIFLNGDLGAGKTTFTRGLVRGQQSPASVSSPTFTLIHEYLGGRIPVIHVDAYRLESPSDAESIGLLNYLDRGDSVVLIEWPSRIASALPTERLEISLEERDEGRCLSLEPFGTGWQSRLDLFADALVGFPPC